MSRSMPVLAAQNSLAQSAPPPTLSAPLNIQSVNLTPTQSVNVTPAPVVPEIVKPEGGFS